MDSGRAIQCFVKAFTFTENLYGGMLESHSYGNGHFISGIPLIGEGPDISFGLHKVEDSLTITIYDDEIFQWLRTIPSLRGHLHSGDSDLNFSSTISMDVLLPCYPELASKFRQDKRTGHSFHALDLFVRHFLRQRSIFLPFGFENLHEKQILTALHFHDMESQSSSLLEDLDSLEDMVNEIDEPGDLNESAEHELLGGRHDPWPNRPVLLTEKPVRSSLRAAIATHDSKTVAEVLDTALGSIDAGTLCHAIRHYECAIFRLLLAHGAQIDGDHLYNEPLYRAAKSGHMDAVQQLLNYGANKEGGNSFASVTPLTGAASAGHLDIVQYLVEDHGANINGNKYWSPLSRAIKNRRIDVVSYLLSADADMLKDDCFELFSQVMKTDQEIFERLIASLSDHTRDKLLSKAASEGRLEICKCLETLGKNVSLVDDESPQNHDTEDSLLNVSRMWYTVALVQRENAAFPYYDTRPPLSLEEWHDSRILPLESDHDAMASFQADKRRTTTGRLLAYIERSDRKLLNAAASAYVSPDFDEFVRQIGAKPSTCMKGISVIRDMCKGNMPSGLQAIISALQVADAMRSASSRLACSKQQFANDVPQWASLLSPRDQYLFHEIASHLWEIPDPSSFWSYSTTYSGYTAGTSFPMGCERTFHRSGALSWLQELVKNFLKISDPVQFSPDVGYESYSLQGLRERHASAMNWGRKGEPRLSLAYSQRLHDPGPQNAVHNHAPSLADLQEHLRFLNRITVLIAGAIFGAIMIYLNMFQTGSSTSFLPITAFSSGQCSTSDQILARNCVLLSLYTGLTPHVKPETWKSIEYLLCLSNTGLHVPPKTAPSRAHQSIWPTFQPSCEGDRSANELSSSIADDSMQDTPSYCSPGLFPHLAANPFESVATMSSSHMTTASLGPTISRTTENGTIRCEHCTAEFKLGKNDLRGQRSNLRRHIKDRHPELVPNCRPTSHRCRWCGKMDNKWNTKVHETNHCRVRKSRQQDH